MTMRHMVSELVEDQLGLNARTPQTLRSLMLRPGALSIDYFSGQIQRYIPPFRLYLIASVIFFLVAGTFTFRGRASDVSQRINTAMDSLGKELQAGRLKNKKVSFGITVGSENHWIGLRLTRFPTDNWLRDSKVDFAWPFLTRIAQQHLRELASLGPTQGSRQLIRSLMDQIPKVLFVLLPIYALLLYAFYWRRRRYFVEHFVFALHLHAFAFLALALQWLPIPWIAVLVPLWIIGYLVIAQHRFYQQSYIMVIAKSVVLSIAYFTIFSFGVLTSLALALTIG